MTEPNIQKGRYLRLDGSPVEHGLMRRLLPPGNLSATFLVSAGLFMEKGAALGDPLTLIFAAFPTTYGALKRAFLNSCHSFTWAFETDKYVIDTRPNTQTISTPPVGYKFRGLFLPAIYSMAGLYALAKNPLDDMFLVIPMELPLLMTAGHQLLTYHKVLTKQWKVIKQSDMEPEVTAKPAIVATLAPSATPG